MAFSAQATEQGARDFSEKIANEAVETLATTQSTASKRKALEQLFTRTVDTNWIGRFVIGKHWKTLSKAQQDEYLVNYKSFLVKHYTSNFQEYAEGTKFAINQSKVLKNSQYMIGMDIERAGAQAVKVDYRVREKGSKYSIIDIVVEGVSLLNTQRSEFSSVVQRKGVEHLIEQLRSKSS